MRRVLAAVAFATVVSMARAGPHLTDPWPEAAGASVRSETVTLHSSDPFAPSDLGRAARRDRRAELYLPAGARPDHGTPAVVFLHGSGGVSSERGERYGRELAAQGVASLVVETYDSRPDLGRSYVDRVLNITETMFVADAYAGLLALAGRPEIDAGHMVLAGFSYGGMAATYALYAQMADRVAPAYPDGRRLHFAGHVAFYAPCIARFQDSRTTGAPLLMLYGDQDELIVPARCGEVAADLRAGGSAASIVSYAGAVHQWDGALPRMLIGRHLGGCSLTVGRGGTIVDDRTGLPMSGPFLRKVILGLCTTAEPYPIGRDEAGAAAVEPGFRGILGTGVRGGPAPG